MGEWKIIVLGESLDTGDGNKFGASGQSSTVVYLRSIYKISIRLNTVEGELGVAKLLVNFFKDCGSACGCVALRNMTVAGRL
jgi:hypothetical protein